MTLYDLLGALPDDDAEGLRTAFRRAVKGAHPDIHPGDPDAAWKFRRIVRAHEILGDEEQRAAYDHLLDLARFEEESASGHATAARIHKVASGVIALAGVSVVTAVSGYLLFMHMSVASVAPADRTNPDTQASASISPAAAPGAPGKSASLLRDQSAGVPGEATGPGDAKLSRARIASDFRNDYLNGAIAGLNRASLLDPKSSPAYIDRGTIFYRLRKFDRAFADIAPAKQIEKPGRSKSTPATADTPHVGPIAIMRSAMPIP